MRRVAGGSHRRVAGLPECDSGDLQLASLRASTSSGLSVMLRGRVDPQRGSSGQIGHDPTLVIQTGNGDRRPARPMGRLCCPERGCGAAGLLGLLRRASGSQRGSLGQIGTSERQRRKSPAAVSDHGASIH